METRIIRGKISLKKIWYFSSRRMGLWCYGKVRIRISDGKPAFSLDGSSPAIHIPSCRVTLVGLYWKRNINRLITWFLKKISNQMDCTVCLELQFQSIHGRQSIEYWDRNSGKCRFLSLYAPLQMGYKKIPSEFICWLHKLDIKPSKPKMLPILRAKQ